MGLKFSKIIPLAPDSEDAQLLIGTLEYVVDTDLLCTLGVNAVVSLIPPTSTSSKARLPALIKAGIDPKEDFLNFPLEDMSETYQSIFREGGILEVIDWIYMKRCEGKKVLVHCDAGPLS